MIRLDNVTKVYDGGVVAVKDAALEINKGEFVFLVGPSGSGKSTLIRLMIREDRPTTGDIWVAGKHASALANWKVPHLRRSIGTVFQDFKLLPNKTVYENVAFALEVTGRHRSVIKSQVPQVLKLVGLSANADRYPRQLSGGEQQRVSIARAFVNRPLILLADEPTGNLDPATSVGIMRILDRINRTGTTVVMATHDHAIVDAMRRRVVQLERGRIVARSAGWPLRPSWCRTGAGAGDAGRFRGPAGRPVRGHRRDPRRRPTDRRPPGRTVGQRPGRHRTRDDRDATRRGRCRPCRHRRRGGRRAGRGARRRRPRGGRAMSIQYVLMEAFNNIRRNGLVVLGAILAVFISLQLMFGTLIFGEIARINTVRWEQDVRVIAFLRDEFRDVEALRDEVEGWEDVAEVIIFSKADAQQEALEMLANNSSAKRLIEERPGILPASIRVRPVDLDQYDPIVQRLQSSPGVSNIITAGPQIAALAALRDGLRVVFSILSVALGIAAVALIANTIQMAIYARREEIEIMRLVGASNWYVRVPFILEGMLEGLLGAGLAIVVAVGVYRVALERLTTLPEFITIDIGSEFLARWSIITLLFGVLVGLVGSSLSLAVHRYLKT